MKTSYLLPSKFKLIGWLLFIPALILVVVAFVADINIDSLLTTTVFAIAENNFFENESYFRFTENAIGDEVLLTFLIIGGIFIGFARQKNEDEYIAQIRYESLVWATYFNFGIVLFATIFIYGIYYFNVLVINAFSLLLFFILRFYIKLAQLNKKAGDDE